ncbi:MAG: hypothetical protein U1E29_03810 [Coriobacteriia bacterium]|nr:hypothetical protein [Coriobacteriia bacterium]
MIRRLLLLAAATAIVIGAIGAPAGAHPKGQGEGCGCHRNGVHTAFAASGGKVSPQACMRCH